MKLTSTNRSIGLIAFIVSAHLWSRYRPLGYLRTMDTNMSKTRFRVTALRWPGDFGGAPTPDPIPNSAVKGSSADGTVSQGTGE